MRLSKRHHILVNIIVHIVTTTRKIQINNVMLHSHKKFGDNNYSLKSKTGEIKNTFRKKIINTDD
jgi:hypothetical protein